MFFFIMTTIKTGWWHIEFTGVEPNESDLENIANLIKSGFVGGQIVQETDLTEQDEEDA